ncbi:hypothetical protein J1614_009880 [Plenodomus biglobosus]|nr:hypothetical protein J1614_009880 [Plenodomus biglobosus]
MFAGSKLEAGVESSLSNVRQALDRGARVVDDFDVCRRALQASRLIGCTGRALEKWSFTWRTGFE